MPSHHTHRHHSTPLGVNVVTHNAASHADSNRPPRIQLDCDDIRNDFGALLNSPRDADARGNEKQVLVAHWLDGATRVAIKSPIRNDLPVSAELWRRFRLERLRMRALRDSPHVARSLGACFRNDSPTAVPIHVVEFASPWKSIPDAYFTVDPPRAVALYLQLLALLRFFARQPGAPLLLCDFHRGQFGVTFSGRLRLLDVDSLAAYRAANASLAAERLQLAAHAVTKAPRLFGDASCKAHADCVQLLKQRRCMAVLVNDEPPLDDVRCNHTSALCHGVDEATMLAASRVILERICDAFDPTQLNCNARGCVFSDEHRVRQGLPAASGAFVTPHTQALARLLRVVMSAVTRRQHAKRPSVEAVERAVHEHVMCSKCTEAETIEQHMKALESL
jgi:hypothetical protein